MSSSRPYSARSRIFAGRRHLCIFLPANAAHGKFLHRDGIPVIGKAVQDTPSGSAGNAADEGIPVSSVRGIPHLAKAVRADTGAPKSSCVLVMIRKLSGTGSEVFSLRTSTERMTAPYGALLFSLRANSRITGSSAHALILTMPPAFLTSPAICSSSASPATKGRNPIPWTAPVTLILYIFQGSFTAGSDKRIGWAGSGAHPARCTHLSAKPLHNNITLEKGGALRYKSPHPPARRDR